MLTTTPTECRMVYKNMGENEPPIADTSRGTKGFLKREKVYHRELTKSGRFCEFL